MASAAERVRELARAVGFDRVALTGADSAVEDGERLASWLAEGKAAGMAWLTRDPLRRAAPRSFLPEARSVISLGVSYFMGEAPPAPGVTFGRVARYAWGEDYHAAVESRLGQFKELLRREFGDVLSRPSVDAQPFLERAFARRSGLGFVGKNTNLIVPGVGSFLFLANLVVSLPFPSDPAVAAGCGACVRCVTRCPTGALPTPFSLDARLCLAYHTIENRGVVPRELRRHVGDWLFGCDDCQDVCPFNSRPLKSRWPEFSPERGVGAWVSLSEVLRLRTAPAFSVRFGGTPLARAKRVGLVRNASLVAAHRRAVDPLEKELRQCLCSDTDPVIRGHAAWSIGDARPSWGPAALRSALGTERDPMVQDEIRAALFSLENP